MTHSRLRAKSWVVVCRRRLKEELRLVDKRDSYDVPDVPTAISVARTEGTPVWLKNVFR